MKLWLDDIRPAPPGWLWAKDYDEAIAYLAGARASRTPLTHMSFDHDLGDTHYRIANAQFQGRSTDHYTTRERSGYDVALWMAEHGIWPTDECVVHSHNPVGAKNIRQVIDRYGPYDKPVRWTPLDLMSQPANPQHIKIMERMANGEI